MTERARLDADGTAKPKTRIVNHPPAGACAGPGMPLHSPEYEAEDGQRIPLSSGEREEMPDVPLWTLSLDVSERSYLLSLLQSDRAALDSLDDPEDFHVRCVNARLIRQLE